RLVTCGSFFDQSEERSDLIPLVGCGLARLSARRRNRCGNDREACEEDDARGSAHSRKGSDRAEGPPGPSTAIVSTLQLTHHFTCATRRSRRPWRIVLGNSRLGPNVWVSVVTTPELSALYTSAWAVSW